MRITSAGSLPELRSMLMDHRRSDICELSSDIAVYHGSSEANLYLVKRPLLPTFLTDSRSYAVLFTDYFGMPKRGHEPTLYTVAIKAGTKLRTTYPQTANDEEDGGVAHSLVDDADGAIVFKIWNAAQLSITESESVTRNLCKSLRE